MNIFVLHEDPVVAAKMLDDTRLGKMLIESGQMLTASLYRHGWTPDRLKRRGVVTSKGEAWRLTHANHPCTLWAGDSRHNFVWLADHAEAIAEEWYMRRGKHHACAIAVRNMRHLRFAIPDSHTGITPWPLAMPDDFKSDDAVASYRAYYASKPRLSWGWTDNRPEWAL